MAVSNDIYASTQRIIKEAPKKGKPSTSPCGHLAKAMKKLNSKKKGT
jgi:hypothetical protein